MCVTLGAINSILLTIENIYKHRIIYAYYSFELYKCIENNLLSSIQQRMVDGCAI